MGQEMVREKILQGQGKVREFYFESGKIDIGRFQKISIPIPQTAFRISEGEEGFTIMDLEGMGGIYNWKSKGMGGFLE